MLRHGRIFETRVSTLTVIAVYSLVFTRIGNAYKWALMAINRVEKSFHI